MKKSIIVTLLLMVFCFSIQTKAVEGNTGNGGNVCGAGFISLARGVIEALNANQLNKLGRGISPDAFDEVKPIYQKLSTISVEVLPVLYLNGKKVDATSYPAKNLIQVSEAFCTMDLEKRVLLVFHELLVISGLEKTFQYGKSSELAKVALENRWYCTSYCLVIGSTKIYEVSGKEYVTTGSSDEDTFLALNSTCANTSEKLCNTFLYGNESKTVLRCVAPATKANSCVKSF